MKKSNFQVLMTYQTLTVKYVLRHYFKDQAFEIRGYRRDTRIDTKLDREVACWKLFNRLNFGEHNASLNAVEVTKNQLDAVKHFKAVTGVHMEGMVLGYENKVKYEVNKLEAIQAITQSN